LEAGGITQEAYDEEAAYAETMFAMPETEIIPYRLEGGNTLVLTLKSIGKAALTRG
jgi:hypothetical protein